MFTFEKDLVGKRIFITGNTGFTGSWLTLWLETLGVDYLGYSLAPETKPALFEVTKLAETGKTIFGDILDYNKLLQSIQDFQPDFVLHLAAQPLVRRSYKDPRYTFNVNCQGTINLLEACRMTNSVVGILCVTTDKVYLNNDSGRKFTEEDELGGRDPYSSSKVAAEHAIHSYRTSFPYSNFEMPLIAVARGGNIIGGGDWSEDRIIPDLVRAAFEGSQVEIRNPKATRPWQHVLALVQGYLNLLSKLSTKNGDEYARAWNFGPTDSSETDVKYLINAAPKSWKIDLPYEINLPATESQRLSIDSTLAREKLEWNPKISIDETLELTFNWYTEFYQNEIPPREICMNQIRAWKTINKT